MPCVQLEAADQITLTSMREYDDGVPLNELSLPNQPVSMPLNDMSRRQLAHAYRLIKHKYGKGRICLSLKPSMLLRCCCASSSQVG